MTPANTKGQVPVNNVLTDVRTQIAGIVLALQALGYVVSSPSDQIKDVREKQQVELTAIRAEHAQRDAAQDRKIDSMLVIIHRVDALAKVKCLETQDRLKRTILECP